MENPACLSCGASGNYYTKPRDNDPEQQVLYCGACNSWIKWLPKNKQPLKRPKLSSGTTEEVWTESGNHCAHCNLTSEALMLLGLQRTVQHVPAFKENGHEGYLIPLCSWCQQHSATQMKQLESLVQRLSRKFAVD